MGSMGEEEDEADSWSQVQTPRFPHEVAKRRALNLATSQASSAPRPAVSDSFQVSSAPCFQARSALDPHQRMAWGRDGRRSSCPGEWWSTELGAPVKIGVDFVPDTQDGGGNEFIFLPNPNSGGCVRDVDEAARCRAQKRGEAAVQRLRQLFPLLPSFSDDLRNYFESRGRKDDKLFARYGISTPSHSMDEPLLDDESEPMVDHGSESSSTSTWFGSMFKSGRPTLVPSMGPSSASGLIRSGPTVAGMSSSSESGGPFRSNVMVLFKRMEGGEKDETKPWDERDEERSWDVKMRPP